MLLLAACLAWQPATAQFASLADGVYSPVQAETGAELYRQHCSHCHDSQFYRDSLRAWDGMTLQDYWYRIRGSMPADKPRSLSDDRMLAILAFILQLNGLPQGTDPLRADNSLGRMRISSAAIPAN